MAKWADYLIAEVRYNAAGTHIDKVRGYVDDGGDSVGASMEKTRQTVVSELKSGTTFCTIFKGDNGKWKQGAAVIIDVVDGTEYIKTKPDNTKRDNLGDLPTY